MDFSGQIVVGHDESPESGKAVRWAAQLARASEKKLTVAHAWIFPMLTKQLGPVEGLGESGLHKSALKTLEHGSTLAEESAPGVEVGTALITGHGRTVLSHASKTADLLAVGSRGLGGFFGMLLGSVSLDLITHAGCPVAVIRDADVESGPVLVGVDGSDAGLEAVDTAARLARAWNTELRIVHARRVIHARTASSEDEAQAIVDAAVARARGGRAGGDASDAMATGASDAPGDDITITGDVIDGRSVARVLLAEAQSARIVVVGFQGEGRRRFGSNAHAIMHHAPGNAVICRHIHIPVDGEDATPQVIAEG